MAPLPLDGVRIVDFTWAGVGPYCTFLCAAMGAECIKVETRSRPTYFRGPVPRSSGETKVPRTISLDELNVGKRSVAINTKHSTGIALVKELVSVSDVVAENFQAGVMERMGLGYGKLREVNPALVMLSMSAHGAAGPESDGKGFAQIFGALGGAGHVSGYEEGPPTELRLPSDLIAGTMACFSLLAGVYHAQRTGEGCFIDCAARETISCFIGEALMDALVNRRDHQRLGNRDLIMAPHNIYRCAGEDAWLSIAVGTEEEWRALCSALGREDWLVAPRLADPYLRWKNQSELDRMVQDWTSIRNKEEAMDFLQSRGVPATASYSALDLLSDPHLNERKNFLLSLSHRPSSRWVGKGVSL